MKLSNLKIGSRLSIGFGAVLAIMVGMTIIGIASLAHIQSGLDRIVSVNVYKSGLYKDMSESVHIISRITRTLIILTDMESMQREKKKLDEARDVYDKAWEALMKTPATEQGKALRARILEVRTASRPINDRLIENALANRNDAATAIMLKEAMPAMQKWQDEIHDAMTMQEDANKKETEDAHVAYAQARALMLMLLAGALALGVAVAWWITRSITVPINQAVGIAEKVAAGDLTGRIEATTTDETGQLLKALKEMNDSLLRIVGQIRTGSETISTASAQIAAGNQDLSSRTEQQASSLEETASSMEELTSTVKQNADNARQANQLAVAASEVAVRGGEVVSQVVSTMDAIQESSKKMSDIISVIDGIAFQTNILALNAAVEAARAGEQGRGFAVVASEVRNLAQRSAAAAKEIKTLIDDSVSKVGSGGKLVHEAGSTMEEVVSSIRRVNDIMSEITAASAEQSAGIEQVNQAIVQMDTVTQQNAALVEEAAAATESMQEQAGRLVQLVSTFKTGNGADIAVQAAAPARTARPAPVVLTVVNAKAAALAVPGALVPQDGTGKDWEEF